MSTNLHEAAVSLQVALRKCEEIRAEIKYILSAEDAAVGDGIPKGDITAAKAHLENASRNVTRVSAELRSFGIGIAETNTVIEAKVDGDGDDEVFPCGC